MRPVDLAKVTLDSVSSNCFANFARHGDAELASLPVTPDLITYESAPYDFLTTFIHVREVAASSQAFFLGKSVQARHLFGSLPPSVKLTVSYDPCAGGCATRGDRLLYSSVRGIHGPAFS
jgi:hypothetical protein